MGTNSGEENSPQSTSAPPSDPLQDTSGDADNPFQGVNPLEGGPAQPAEVDTGEPADQEDFASSTSTAESEPASPGIEVNDDPPDQNPLDREALDDGIPHGSSIFPSSGETVGTGGDPFDQKPSGDATAESGVATILPSVTQPVSSEEPLTNRSGQQTDPPAPRRGVADRIKQNAQKQSQQGLRTKLFGTKKRVAKTAFGLLVLLAAIWFILNASGVNFLGGDLFGNGGDMPPTEVADDGSVAEAGGSNLGVDFSRDDFCTSAEVPSLADVGVLRWGDSLVYDNIADLWPAGGVRAGAEAVLDNAKLSLYQTVADWCTSPGVALGRNFNPRSIDGGRVDMDDYDAKSRIAVYEEDDDTRVAVAKETARQLDSCADAQFVYLDSATTPTVYVVAYARDYSNVVFVQMPLPQIDDFPDGDQGLIAVRCSLGKSEGADGDSAEQVLISPTLRTLVFTEPPVEESRLLVMESDDETNDEGEDGTGDNPTTGPEEENTAADEQDASGEENPANDPEDLNPAADDEEASSLVDEGSSSDETDPETNENQAAVTENETNPTDDQELTDPTDGANQQSVGDDQTTVVNDDANQDATTDETGSQTDPTQDETDPTTSTDGDGSTTDPDTGDGSDTSGCDQEDCDTSGQDPGSGTQPGDDGDQGDCTTDCPGDGNDGDDTCTQNCPSDGDDGDGDDTCTQNCPSDGDDGDGDDTCTQNCPGDGDDGDDGDDTCTQNCPGDGDDGDNDDDDDCPAGSPRDNYGNCKAQEPDEDPDW